MYVYISRTRHGVARLLICLPIYYLLILVIPDNEFLIICLSIDNYSYS